MKNSQNSETSSVLDSRRTKNVKKSRSITIYPEEYCLEISNRCTRHGKTTVSRKWIEKHGRMEVLDMLEFS